MVSEALLHAHWMIADAIRRAVYTGPVFGLLLRKQREYYRGRRAEMKRQTAGCFYSGILLKFQGAKVPECPVHLQLRLGGTAANMADDLMASRLSKKGRRKQELSDQALQREIANDATNVHIEIDGVQMPSGSDSMSEDNSVMPPSVVHSGEEEGWGRERVTDSDTASI